MRQVQLSSLYMASQRLQNRLMVRRNIEGIQANLPLFSGTQENGLDALLADVPPCVPPSCFCFSSRFVLFVHMAGQKWVSPKMGQALVNGTDEKKKLGSNSFHGPHTPQPGIR